MKTRRTLNDLFQFFDGEGGAAGGGAGGGQGGDGGGGNGGPPGVVDIRQHLSDDGSFKPDWHKAVGVSEALAKKFTRPEALARSYEQLEGQIGKKGVIIPGPNATPAERDAYFTALGRPATPEEYGFTKPATIKVGDREMPVPDVAWDANRAKDWQQYLFENGASKELAQKIMLKATTESVTGLDMIKGAEKQLIATAKAELTKEWGADYDKNMGAAVRAAEQFGFDYKNHPGATDPAFIRLLAKVGAATAERPGAGTRQQAGSDNLTAAEARIKGIQLTAEIAKRVKENRNWGNSAEAAQMKAEKTRMFQLANPG